VSPVSPSINETPAPPAEALIIYSTTWCGPCRTLKRLLAEQGITFTEVNIEETPGAAEFVMSVNRGNQTVPTVLFPDGSTLTNPRLSDVTAKLELVSATALKKASTD
jgi:mycoredoxin